MDDLSHSVFQCYAQNKNILNQCFVSGQELRKRMTRDLLRKAIVEQFPPQRVAEIVDHVQSGGHKIFAILILMKQCGFFDKFIQDRLYSSADIDSLLPYEERDLLPKFSNSQLALDFFQKQWSFIAPVFSDSVFKAELRSEVVLPFLRDDFLESGGFGDVYDVEIESSHQRFSDTSLRQQGTVRKEFLPQPDQDKTYEKELDNLAILKLLRHPNMVDLKAAYSHRGKLNLIFPKARGGTLGAFLTKPRPHVFYDDATILFALSGLCSAVNAVHYFMVSGDVDLKRIGCHHDLKPSNVLIEGCRFLLADFGLSRFKNVSQSSDTPAKKVHAYYTAPECSAASGDGQMPRVRRSSDIWSLGCIIAEVVTYMLRGKDGVEEFERSRRYQDGPSTEFRFHRAGAENPGVIEWIRKMREATSIIQNQLGELVENMLQIQASKRPSCLVVKARMRSIALGFQSDHISTMYESICGRSQCTEADLMRADFEGWKNACPMLEMSGESHEQRTDDNEFRLIQETLEQIYKKLQDIDKRSRVQEALFEPLRQCNKLLKSHLPPEQRDRAEDYSDLRLMSNSSNLIDLNRNMFNDRFPDAQRRRKLSEVASLIRGIPERSLTGRSFIDAGQLELISLVGDFMIQNLEIGATGDKQQVLVETKLYREHPEDEDAARELRKRLELLTEILQKVQNAPEEERFRVLPCLGYYYDYHQENYHDTYARSCGLIYKYPDPTLSRRYTTLQLALRDSKDKSADEPSLAQRFELAKTLASSVLQFHKVRWLQKSISSFNVGFFYDKGESWLAGLSNPFFLGYSYSRSHDTGTFTEGPDQNSGHALYQHPDYQAGRSAYRAEYDYYSLGLLLLEIGLWESLQDRKLSRRKMSFREKILDEVVPHLRFTMGPNFQRVVETCLRSEFDGSGASGKEGDYTTLCISFSKSVIDGIGNFPM